MAQSDDLPRVIDTNAFFDARAPEVQALQQVLSTGQGGAGGQHAGRQARRRTTSYKAYRHVRRPNAKLRQGAGAGDTDAAAASAAAVTPPVGSSEAKAEGERPTSRAMRRRPGRLRIAAELSCAAAVVDAGQLGQQRRLETHMWHVKRMNMQEREAGTAERVLDAAAKPWREHDVMLHHPGRWPGGTISPARALLLPALSDDGATEPAAGAAAADEAPGRMWLWLHPAAYHEALAMLQQLCRQQPADSPVGDSTQLQQQQGAAVQRPTEHSHQQADQPSMAEPLQLQASAEAQPAEQQGSAATTGEGMGVAAAGVHITPLASHLRRLELRGPASTALLAGLLPDFRALTSGPAPDGAVLSCMVQDPRLISGDGAAPDSAAGSDADVKTAAIAAAEAPPAGSRAAVPESATSDWLWDRPQAVLPPHSEHQISRWRQRRRLAELGLSSAEPAPLSAAKPARAAACPMMLVKRRTFGALGAGWSVVAPARWVAPLWQAALQRGARAAGQREWRWVAADQGCASFPWDFPDTRAGATEAAAEAAADAARRARATKAKQPLRTPQWHSLDMRPPAAGHAAPPAQDAAAGAASASATQLPVAAASAPPEAAAAAAAVRLNAGAGTPEQAAAVSESHVDQAGQLGQAAGPTPMDTDCNEGAVAPMQLEAATPVPDPAPAVSANAATATVPGRMRRKNHKDKGTGGSKGGPHAAMAAVRSTNAASAAEPPTPLLPPGWWVARTATALAQALPRAQLLPVSVAARPMQQRRGAPVAGAAAARAAAMDDASSAPSPPAATPAMAPAAPPAAPAAAGHDAAVQPAGGTSSERCLVRVRMHMTGRGTAEAGAAICCQLPAAAPEGPAAGALLRAQPPQGQQLIGFVMAPAVRGTCAWAGASALGSAAALDRVCQQQASGEAEGASQPGRPAGIPVLVVHPTTGEHMPAVASLVLNGRAGDTCM